MKTMLTIAAFAMSLTFAAAQNKNYSYGGYKPPLPGNGVAKGNPVFKGNNKFDKRDNNFDYRNNKDETDRINRDYDNKVRAIQQDRNLSSFERNRQLQILQLERQKQLRSVSNNGYNDNSYGSNKNCNKNNKGHKKSKNGK